MVSKQESNSSSSGPAVVAVRDVRKFYGRRLVLEIPKFDVCAGDTVALVGHNGSGKSTLLRLLSGTTLQTSGTVSRSDAWHQARIGVVPQSGGINPELTVAENMQMYRRLYDRDAEVEAAESSLVEDFGFIDVMNERAGNLSGGYQRLLAVVSTLETMPDGLLLDEPFSGLDRRHSELLRKTLNDRIQNLLFLVITAHADEHIPDVANRLALKNGSPL